MRKRILLMICILTLLVSGLFLITSCGDETVDTCDHEWSEWSTKTEPTCENQGTKERTCSKCNTTETGSIDALMHVGGTATCTEQAVCSVCNSKYGETLKHDYAEATCTAPKTCKVCSATEGEALGHSGGTATCELLATCTVCGVEYGNYAAHVYDNLNTNALYRISEATCTNAALYYYSCACGEKGTATFEYGNKIDHDYICEANGDGTHTLVCRNDSTHRTVESCKGGAATCIDKAVCSLCSEEYGEALGHDWILPPSAVSSESSCETSSTVVYVCSHCDATKSVIVPAKGHDYVSVVTEPTCVDKGYTTHTCKDCNKSYVDSEVLPTGEHTWDKARTCEEGHSCTVCGTSEAALGHSYKLTGHTPATCTSAAIDVYTCSNEGCGDSYEAEDGEALGHNITGVKATETQVGDTCEYVQSYKCNNCSEYVIGENVFHHEYTAAVTTEANCKNEGVKTYTCKCGDSYTEKIEIDENNHKWNEGVLSGSIKTYTCTVDGCGATKTVVVAAESNKADGLDSSALAGSGVEFKDATLDVSGLTGNGGVLEGKDDVSLSAGKLDQTEADAIKNSLTEEEKAQIGNKPIYNFTMTVGGNTVYNFNGDKVTVTIPYTPTTSEDVDSIAIWYIADDGTLKSIKAYYSNGYVTFETEHFSIYTVTELTPKQRCELYGHSYTKKVVAPTCSAEGYTLYLCIRCAGSYKDDFVDPVGHDYAVTTNVAPTCTRAGRIVYTCQNGCGRSYTERVAATGHSYTVEVKDATCTEAGYEKGVCACGNEYNVVFPKLRHNMTFTVYQPDCDTDGYTHYECTGCDYEYTDNITSATGHYLVGVWAWGEDHKTAELTLTCSLGCDFEHTETVNATEKNVASTCTKAGRVDFVVKTVYNGETFDAIYSEAKALADHEYGTDLKHDAYGHWYACKNCAAPGESVAHVWGEGKVTKTATCKVEGEMSYVCACGEIKTESIAKTDDHKYSGNVCTVCGDVKACEHTFDGGVVTTAPTCITEGVRTFTCTICGTEKTQSIAKIDEHKFGEGVVTTAPGCLTAGIKTYTCELCGKTKTEPVPYLGGHSYETVVTVEAGCFTDGVKTSTCTRCGDVKTEKIKAYGSHNYNSGTVTKAPGCETDGIMTYTCERCGSAKAEKIDAIGSHNYDAGIITKAPGCETEGVKTFTCTQCGDSYTETVAAIGSHTYGTPIVTVAPGCETSGAQVSICTVCGNKKSETVASLGGHVYDEGVVTTAPTCLTNGVKTFTCVNCDDSYTESIEKTEHNYNGGVCVDCGISNVCDHTFDAGKITVRATCANEGVRTFECTKCHGTKTEVIPKSDVHLYDGGIVTTAPGCVTEGVRTYTCERCDATVTEAIASLGGHVYDDGEITTAPGCVTDGVKTYTCERCDATVTETVDSLGGHDYGEGVVTTAPTCATDGVMTYTCERCGETKTEVILRNDSHAYDDGEVTKAPNCSEEGIMTYTCTLCGGTKTEAIAKNDDHSFDEGVVTTEPTCIAPGVKTYTCENCGATETEAVPASDAHNYDDGVVTTAPTCAAEGVMTYTCTLCGDFYTESIEKTDDHKYGDVAHITKYPTCKTEGEATQTCSVCGNVNVVTVPVNPDAHTWDEGVVTTPATCKADGVMTYTCTLCGKTRTEVIPADPTAHAWNEGVVTTAPGCVTEGVKTYTCSVCEKTRTEKIDSLGGHNYVDGSCTVCGREEGSCDHTELHDVTVDLKELGACGGTLVYQTCECGEVKLIDFDAFEEIVDGNCDFEGDEEYGENEDGSQWMRTTGTCSDCGMVISIEATATLDGCYFYVVYNFDISIGDTEIVTDLVSEMVEEEHDEREVEIDLEKLGACGGTLWVMKCAECGKTFDMDEPELVCNGGELVTEEGVDDDGNMFMKISSSCEECGLVLIAEMKMVVVSPCEQRMVITYYVAIGDNVIVNSLMEDSETHHNWETTYELLGESCEDGYLVYQTCSACGSSHSWTEEGHRFEYFEEDLRNLGLCGGMISGERCIICNEIRNVHDMRLECSEENADKKEVIDENGVAHFIYIFDCTKCGHHFEMDSYQSETECISMYAQVLKISKDGEVVYELPVIQKEYHHNYEYSYEFREGNNCEKGVNVIGTCTVCGNVTETTFFTHNYEFNRTEIDLSAYGICGGFLTTYECPCGQAKRLEYNFNCKFEYSSDSYIDDFGTFHDVYYSTCQKCGLSYTRDSYTVQEGCYSIEYITYNVTAGENSILSDFKVINGKYSHHSYEYTYRMEGDSCTDGIYIDAVCTVCGERTGMGTSQHALLVTQNYTFVDYGACEKHFFNLYSCPCGEEYQYESDADALIFDETLGKYVCADCGYSIDIEENVTSVGCERTVSLTVSVSVGEYSEVLYSKTVTSVSHSFEVVSVYVDEKGEIVPYLVCSGCDTVADQSAKCTHNGERKRFTYLPETSSDCDDGVYVGYYCPYCGNCDKMYVEYGHMSYLKEQHTFTKYGACERHYLNVYGCPCGQNNHMDTDMHSMDVDNGVRFCKECGLSYIEKNFSSQNGCTVEDVYQITVTIGDYSEVVYRGVNSRISHSFVFSEVIGENGEVSYVGACSVCGISVVNPVNTVTLNNVDGQYYYDIYFTPDVYGMHAIFALGNEDTYAVLYRMEGDSLIEIASSSNDHYYGGMNFRIQYHLEQGMTYVYRIGYEGFAMEGSISYMLYRPTAECSHNFGTKDFSFFIAGSESCEDGYLRGSACTKCGVISAIREQYYHSTFVKEYFNLDEYDICQDHYIYVNECLCGESQHYDLGTHMLSYNEETRSYVCYNCSYSVREYTEYQYDGCLRHSLRSVEITVNGVSEVLYSFVSTDTVHDYETVATENANGILTLTNTCKTCGDTYSLTEQVATVTDHDGENYAEIEINPTIDGEFFIATLDAFYAYAELYRKNGEELEQIYSSDGYEVFRLSYHLEANNSYVVRIRYHESEKVGNVKYILVMNDGCSHSDKESVRNNFTIFADGADSCDEGIFSGNFCASCGKFTSIEKYNYHYINNYEYVRFEEYGACHDHYVSVGRCICGEHSDYSYPSYNLGWDDENRMYYCYNCPFTLKTVDEVVYEDCLKKDIFKVVVTVGEYTVDAFVRENAVEYHSYESTVTKVNDGYYIVNSVCSACAKTVSHGENIVEAELTKQDDGRYYYEIEVTPENTLEYVIYSVGTDDTYVELYRKNGDNFEYISSVDSGSNYGNFRMHYVLNKGVTYVYRIGYYNFDREGTVKYALEAINCNHNYKNLEVFATEIKDCEAGIYRGEICTGCGFIPNIYIDSGHNTYIVDTIELSKYGVCEKAGYAEIYECACGKRSYVNVNYYCSSESKYETIVDENGIEHNIETITCTNGCGFVLIIDSYMAIEGCETLCYSVYSLTVGESVVLDDYVATPERQADHDYVASFEFDGDTCSDGYTLIQTCRDCGFVRREQRYGCDSFFVGSVNLDEYVENTDSCGGYIDFYSCACGSWARVENNVKCSLSYSSSDYTDENGVYHSVTTQSCNQCGLVFSTDNFIVTEGCYTTTYIVYNVSYGEEAVLEDYEFVSGRNANHVYTYEFEMNGETCNDGYYAIATCTGCGKTVHESHGGHSTFPVAVYNLSEYGACSGTVRIFSCPCGQEGFIEENYGCFMDMNSETVTASDGTKHYVSTYTCSRCDIEVVTDKYSVIDGCFTYNYIDYSVSFGGEEVVYHNYSNEKTEHHNYSYEFDMRGETCDYGYTAYGTCLDCGKTTESSYSYHHQFAVERYALDEYGACVGGYAYVYECPCGSSRRFSCTLSGCSLTSRYETVTDDSGISHEIRYETCQHCGLEIARDVYTVWENCKDVTYYSYSIKVGESVVLDDYTYVYSYSTAHKYQTSFTLNGESCEDGYTATHDCLYCDYTYTTNGYSHNYYVVEKYNLTEAGACGSNSYVQLSKCPCGQNESVERNFYACNYHYNSNNQEVDGVIQTTERYWCDDCGMAYQHTYYSLQDVENCKLNTYHTVVVNVGLNAVANFTYVTSSVSHSETVSATLMDGATNCNDGVIITRTCSVCGNVESNNYYHHYSYVKENIALGGECGGYAQYLGCACGNTASVSLSNNLHEFDGISVAPWVDGVLPNGWYEIGNKSEYIYSSFNVYTCAQTDPACAYKYRVANYWILEDGCRAANYVCYQFGYDEKTGSYEKEVFFVVKGNEKTYHTYVSEDISRTLDDGTQVIGTKYTCSKCGTYYYNEEYYSTDGTCIKSEFKFENMLDDGHYKSEIRVSEKAPLRDGGYYDSSSYTEIIYKDGSKYYESLVTAYDYDYVAPYGTGSYKITQQRTCSNGSDNYISENAYTKIEGVGYVEVYSFTKRNIGTSDENFDRYEYTYNFVGTCERTTVYTNNYGENRTYTDPYHSTYYRVSKNPTCTQDGAYHYVCERCNQITSEGTISPSYHSWSYNGFEYYCDRCGLKNANGANGDVILEDLTGLYGNGENYVIGYYFIDGKYQYFYNASLMLHTPLANGNNQIVLDNVVFTELEGVRAIAVSISEIEAAALELGYTADMYDVRISIVPIGADESHDYAITITEKPYDSSVITDGAKLNVYVAREDEETVIITPATSGSWNFSVKTDRYVTLEVYDYEGNCLYGNSYVENYNFNCDLVAGETYTVRVCWSYSDNCGYVPVTITAPTEA